MERGRLRWIIASIVLGLCAWVVPRDVEASPTPRESNYSELQKALAKVRGATVSTVCGSSLRLMYRAALAPVDEHQGVYSRASVDADWARAFVAAVFQDSGFGWSEYCGDSYQPCGEYRGVPMVLVSLRTSFMGRVDVLVHLGNRCAQFIGYGAQATAQFNDRADSIFVLIQHALPKDQRLHAMRLLPALEPPGWTHGPVLESDGKVIGSLPEPQYREPVSYPELAREAMVDGDVKVMTLVGSDGLVYDARIVKSIPMLDQAAMDSIRKWKFRPGTSKDGQAIPVWLTVPVRFSLK